MKWIIVADSSCDLRQNDISDSDVGFSTVPFSICVGSHDYVDEEDLDVPAMLSDMEGTSIASHTACPSPSAWASQFEKADNVIAVTISGNLSGSLNSANAAKKMVLEQYPDKNISIIDSKSTGPEVALCIAHMVEWIRLNLSLREITHKAEEFFTRCKTSFALCSFDNLVKNGRMSKLTGFVARKLGMWGIGIGSDTGTITMRGKSRGVAKAIHILLEDMAERGYSGGEAMISHCFNEPMAQQLRDCILERWNTAKNIRIVNARGLDSFYAERGGLILGFCGT